MTGEYLFQLAFDIRRVECYKLPVASTRCWCFDMLPVAVRHVAGVDGA